MRSVIRTYFLVTLACLSSATTACKEDPTIWSADSLSPDGSWLAHAYTVRHSGFGNAGVETIVELKLQSGLRDNVKILAFSDGGDLMHLKMDWLSPDSLHVTYADDPEVLYFVVVKTSGIEIAVDNVDPRPAKGRTPAIRKPNLLDRIAPAK